MAKVKKETIEAAMLSLIDKISATMPNTAYKFALGGAAGLMTLKGMDKLGSMLSVFEDEHGLIDTDKVRKWYETAFRAAGNKLQLELFSQPNSLLTMFIKPLTLTITKDDIDALMHEVEANSVVTEVNLSSGSAVALA